MARPADSLGAAVASASVVKLAAAKDADRVVSGSAKGWHYVRIKVFGADGSLVQKNDAVVNQTDNTFVAGLPSALAAGQVIQGFALEDERETTVSNPLVVSAAAPAPTKKTDANTPAANGTATKDTTELFEAKEGDPIIRGYAAADVDSVKITVKKGSESGPRQKGDNFVPSNAVIQESGSAQLDATKHTFTFEPRFPLEEGTVIEAQPLDKNGNNLVAPAPVDVESVDLDWGNVRAYFTLGLVLAQNSDNFNVNSASPFIDFSLQKNWLWRQPSWFRETGGKGERHGWGGYRLDSFFDTRLTSIATTASTAKANNSTTGSTVTPASVLLSQQAASMQTGFFLPLIANNYSYAGRRYSLFVAPITKVGMYTPTSTAAVTNANSGVTATPTSNARFFPFFANGVRMGHYQDSKDGSDLLSYLDIAVGRFGNFEYTTPGCSGVAGSGDCLRQRLLRYSFEGMIKVPHTPLILGMSANIAAQRSHNPLMTAPQDDLRFLFGAKFDARRMITGLFNSRTE